MVNRVIDLISRKNLCATSSGLHIYECGDAYRQTFFKREQASYIGRYLCTVIFCDVEWAVILHDHKYLYVKDLKTFKKKKE